MSNTSYKVVVLGTGGVGKSALSIQFVKGEFVNDYEPTIEENHKKIFTVDNHTIQLDILDTAGMENISHLRQTSLKAGQGFVIVFALNERETFERIQEIHDDLLTTKGVQSVPLVICGNKSDLDGREVTTEEAQKKAAEMKGKYLETSAKNKINVDNAFMEVVREIWKSGVEKPPEPSKIQTGTRKHKCNLL